MSRKPKPNPFEPPSYNEPFQPGPRDPFAGKPKDPFSTGAGAASASHSNPLGVTGFVTSIFGLFCCGLVSMVSCVVCLIAMRREPRGLAIAGLAVSIVGMLIHLAFAGLMLVGAALQGRGDAMAGFEVLFDAGAIDAGIQQRGSMPAGLDELRLAPDRTTDPWGNAYHYEVFSDGGDYKLVSLGPDGQLDTSDDIQLHPQY